MGIEDDPATVTPEDITEVVEEALLVMTNNTQITQEVTTEVQVVHHITHKMLVNIKC